MLFFIINQTRLFLDIICTIGRKAIAREADTKLKYQINYRAIWLQQQQQLHPQQLLPQILTLFPNGRLLETGLTFVSVIYHVLANLPNCGFMAEFAKLIGEIRGIE